MDGTTTKFFYVYGVAGALSSQPSHFLGDHSFLLCSEMVEL